MSLVADLCDQIVADDRFGALLAQLADDVLGCDLTFEKTLHGTVGEPVKWKEITADWIVGYDDDELKSIIVWALVTGIAFAKHETWVEVEGGKRIVPSLKWWHPQHFEFRPLDGVPTNQLGGDLSNHRWHVRNADGNWTPITSGDGTWVIVTRQSEYRPWAHGLWRGLGVWWLLKQYAMLDSGVHSEKASKVVVTANEGSSVEERRQIAQYIYEAGKDPVIALPAGFDMKLLEIEANIDQIYHSQIRLANESAALAILGQNLSTTVDGGSLAAAKEHSRKESRRVRNAAQMLSKNLQAQSLWWWAEHNFGDKSLAPYPRWHTEPPQDFAAKASVLQQTATALLTLKTAGWETDEEWIEEELGLPLRKTKALVAKEQAEPGDTDGDGIPHNEPGNPTAPGVKGDEDPTPDVKPPKVAPPRARPPKPPAPPTAQAFLASGDSAAEAQGFVRGQLYVDELSDNSTALAADELSGFVERLLKAIDGADDYESIRYRVIKTFRDETEPDVLAQLVERAMLLADLAGRYAVQEDVPGE